MTTKSVSKLVKEYLRKYTSFDDHDVSVVAGYVMATWLYLRYDHVKYLRIKSPVGSGNTTALRAIGKICINPIFVSEASSERTMLYVLDGASKGNGHTLLIDDARFDVTDKDGNMTTFSTILNCGALRGNSIISMKEGIVSHFNVFGPKVFVRRNSFCYPPIDSKCITVEAKQREHLPVFDIMNGIDNDAVAVNEAVSDWANSIYAKKRMNPSFLHLVFLLGGVK